MADGRFCGPLAGEFAAFAATLEASATASKTTLTQLRALDRYTAQRGLPSQSQQHSRPSCRSERTQESNQLIGLRRNRIAALPGRMRFSASTGLRRGHTRPATVLYVGELQPALQAGLRDPEVLGELSKRRLALASDRDQILTELQRECFRHAEHPSSKDESPQARSQLTWGQSRYR
jgi:hypothetical protein